MKTTRNHWTCWSFSLILFCLFFIPVLNAATPEGDFRILKSRKGIDLYYRWMAMPDGNRVRQMKAVLEVEGTPSEVMSLLKDEQKAVRWISGAEAYENLTQAGGSDWFSYLLLSVPWPLSDQDAILEYHSYANERGETVVDFACRPDYLDPVDGVSRMKDITGSFVIRPLPGGKCILECYFLSHKRSVIPVWLTDPIITGNIISLMESLREELKEA